MVQRRERAHPPIPNGWFAVAWSNEVRAGEVRPLRYFGQDLVLFRSRSGVPSVLDAYCAHLGAHLGVGGCVVGEMIACPFHGWRYDGQGQCREVPYSARIPNRASVRAWPTAEVNGVIQVYHHVEGQAPGAPPAAFSQLEEPGWQRLRRSELLMRSHPQELLENAFDLAHFTAVHRVTTPELLAHEENERTMTVRLLSRPMVANYALPITGQINSTAHELGHVTVNVRIDPLCNLFILQYATPVEDDKLHVRHVYLGEVGHGVARPLRWLAQTIMRLEAQRQVGTDIPIWNHKIHRPIPTLCPEDRLLGTFRKWAKKFYATSDAPAGTQCD